MPDARIPEPGPRIAEAFAALPLETPDRSAWPALAARIEAASAPRRRPLHRHWLFALATAAAVAVIALMPRTLTGPVDTTAPATLAATASEPVPLQALMAESARLEYLLQAVSDDGMATGSFTALALEYESRVQQLDVALSDPKLSSDDRMALWSRRVDLLREYAGLQGTAQWLAAQGNGFDGDLVAVY